MLHALKYERQEEAVARLAYLMARRVRSRTELRSCEVIVPLPMRPALHSRYATDEDILRGIRQAVALA
jgi:predicted amidophosphoribosyltransferase